MKEKLLKWALEYLLTPATVKKLIREANKRLQEKAALADGKQKIAGYLEDAMATAAAYAGAVSDDGKISDAELDIIDTRTDALVDKYFPKEF